MSDKDKWIDASKIKPEPFDLCSLKTETKIKSGWYTGSIWDGANVQHNEKVLFWKKKMGEYYVC